MKLINGYYRVVIGRIEKESVTESARTVSLSARDAIEAINDTELEHEDEFISAVILLERA